MAPGIITVLMRFKTDGEAQLQQDAVTDACEQVGYTAWRDRLLNPVIIVRLFLLQMLHGNTTCRHLPLYPAYASTSRPTVRPISNCPWRFPHTSWSAWDARPTPHSPRTAAGMVIARSSSMAQAAPCQIRPCGKTSSASPRSNGRAVDFPWRA
jgi:hypothetical protein